MRYPNLPRMKVLVDGRDTGLAAFRASSFVARMFGMKEMQRLMVSSESYRGASSMDAASDSANTKIDPANDYLLTFRLKRLEAEPIWVSILTA